jgi:hypothetical protein
MFPVKKSISFENETFKSNICFLQNVSQKRNKDKNNSVGGRKSHFK